MLYIVLELLLKNSADRFVELIRGGTGMSNRDIVLGVMEGMNKGLVRVSGVKKINYHITRKGRKIFTELDLRPGTLRDDFKNFESEVYNIHGTHRYKYVSEIRKELNSRLGYIQYKLDRHKKVFNTDSYLLKSKYIIASQLDVVNKVIID